MRAVVVAGWVLATLVVGLLSWLGRASPGTGTTQPAPSVSESGGTTLGAGDVLTLGRDEEARSGSAAPAAEHAALDPRGTRRAAQDDRTVARVRVIDAGSGRPLSGVRVGVWRRAPEVARQAGGWLPMFDLEVSAQLVGHVPGASGVSGEDGVLELDLGGGGSFQIVGQSSGVSRRQAVEAAEGERVEVVLSFELFEFWLAPRDAATGQRLGSGELSVSSRSGLEITAEDDGLFRVSSYRGPTHGRVSIGGGPCVRREVEVVEGHGSPATALVVRLERQPTLVLLALGAGGRPLAGVRFSVDNWSAITNAAGRARLEVLPAGQALSVTEVAVDGRRKRFIESVTLREGETRELVCRVRGDTRLDLSVIDGEGAPIDGLRLDLVPAAALETPDHVWLDQLGAPSWYALTDEQGAARFESVPGGAWWIVPAEPYLPLPARIDVGGWGGAQALDIVASRGLSLTVDLLAGDPSQSELAGMPPGGRGAQSLWSGIEVWAQAAGEGSSAAQSPLVLADAGGFGSGFGSWNSVPGTYRVDGLPAGLYTIHARAQLDGVPYEARAYVRAGERGVLRLAPSE